MKISAHLYNDRVSGNGSNINGGELLLLALVQHTDTMTEIQNTLRSGINVILNRTTAVPE